MEEELKSVGKCFFCNQEFDQRQIGKHLRKHLSEIEKEDHAKITNGYHHIVVGAGIMFLHILVKSSARMKVIDKFLRAIWLDCCEHLSDFRYKRLGIEMSDAAGSIFFPKEKIYHEYDFGSTTRLELKAIKTYSLHLKEDLILLSRNEPLKYMCSVCKKLPATNLCTECSWEMYAFFCDKCSAKHAETCESFADYSKMRVVNSPRMGICGYEGGSIDLQRDGVYKI